MPALDSTAIQVQIQIQNRSKLYVCNLDVQKPFDRMWHSGLFLKLNDMSIKYELLRIIIDLHMNMKSSVLYKGHNSDWFDVLQGNRQGGILSPLLFLCLTNDLLNELCNCTAGLRI